MQLLTNSHFHPHGIKVCCRVLQGVAVRYSVLQRVALCCSVLRCVAVGNGADEKLAPWSLRSSIYVLLQ